MLPATDDKVERWRIKYGGDFPDYLKKVKEGKLTIQELADWMKVTKETARRYFHKYYSEADLVGTRFFKQGDAIRLPQQSVGMDDSKILTAVRLLKNDMVDLITKRFDEIKEELYAIRLPEEPTKRDTLKLSTAVRLPDNKRILEQLDYLSGVIEGVDKGVDQIIEHIENGG